MKARPPLKLHHWLPFLLTFVLLVTGISACAPASRTVAGTGKVISGTHRFIEKHGHLSTEPQLDPNDPLYWQMWQDNWGGN